jgi:hypothetical protein
MRGSVKRAWFGGMLAVALSAASVHAESALVTIEGGVDDTLHGYKWTIINHHTSPIVYVEFPHYGADTFSPPVHGWKQKTTNLVGTTRPAGEKSVCIAEAEPNGPGIPRGGAQTFEMRIAPAGAATGRRSVTIRFRDGTETVVTNVEVPVAPPTSRNLSLIGAALIFGGYVLFRALRDRRRRRSEQQATESARTAES